MKKVILMMCLFVLVFQWSLFSEEKIVAEKIILPAPVITGGMPLMEALSSRMTNRNFSEKELTPQLLSNLLWAGFGINRKDNGKRTAPSARNWQEIDIYVALKSGLYLYNAKDHQLVLTLKKDVREFVGKQDFTQVAPVGLIYVSDYSKITGNGVEEQQKMVYSAVDTGFISQNVYLFCASENLATVVLGYVDKPLLEKNMEIRKDQKVVFTQPVGYHKEK